MWPIIVISFYRIIVHQKHHCDEGLKVTNTTYYCCFIPHRKLCFNLNVNLLRTYKLLYSMFFWREHLRNSPNYPRSLYPQHRLSVGLKRCIAICFPLVICCQKKITTFCILEVKIIMIRYYIAFYRFGPAKFDCGGSVLGSSPSCL